MPLLGLGKDKFWKCSVRQEWWACLVVSVVMVSVWFFMLFWLCSFIWFRIRICLLEKTKTEGSGTNEMASSSSLWPIYSSKSSMSLKSPVQSTKKAFCLFNLQKVFIYVGQRDNIWVLWMLYFFQSCLSLPMGWLHQRKAGSKLWGAKGQQSQNHVNTSPSRVALQAQPGRRPNWVEGQGLEKCSKVGERAGTPNVACL